MTAMRGSCSAPRSTDDAAHRLVVQGIPRLVVGGKIQPLKPQLAERTAVCAKDSVVVLVVSTKVETTAFARFLADPPDQGGLGCRDALNLDGGPSTQLVVKLPALSLSVPGGWGVPNALVVLRARCKRRRRYGISQLLPSQAMTSSSSLPTPAA